MDKKCEINEDPLAQITFLDSLLRTWTKAKRKKDKQLFVIIMSKSITKLQKEEGL